MRNWIVLRQRVVGRKQHKRIYDWMREMRQEHKYIERLESPPRHRRTFQSRVDESRRGQKRVSIKSLSRDFEAAR